LAERAGFGEHTLDYHDREAEVQQRSD
jgi:hypothetical protein